MDGTGAEVIDDENYKKSNLQWIADGRLVYISTDRNCAYVIDPEKRETRKVICFNLDERLEGFRVSPDGGTAAISVARTLYIVPFDLDQFKNRITRFLLEGLAPSCKYDDLPAKDVLWSKDGMHIVALVLDTDGTEQIYLINVTNLECDSQVPVATDKFPAGRFEFGGNSTIPSYDWDGDHLFLLNDYVRNDGFGNLYMYDSQTHEGWVINPIDNGSCCYRDARWSADGKYILFLYQNELGRTISMYYIPADELETGTSWKPIVVAPGIFSNPREKPQPVLRVAR